jgi:hypothetical protein
LKYATWKLNFIDPQYGTGPEDKIAQLGAQAQGAWVCNETILGYVSDLVDPKKLKSWNFTELTQEEALDFCFSINSEAYLLPDGSIVAPIQNIIP